jgi:hypothetical protein
MLSRLALLASIAVVVSGCSMTLPVTGLVEGTGETFTGTATGYADGAGNLEIRSAKKPC